MRKRFLYSIILALVLNIEIYSLADKVIISKRNEPINTETGFFDSQGREVYLDMYEGSTVLLVFWATWCGGCVNEIASLDILQKDFRKLPFKVIAVSEDYNGVEAVGKHFADNKIRYLEIFHDYQNKLFTALKISGLPTAYLINQEGKLKYIFNGTVKWQDDKVREMILAEIEGNPVLPKNTFTDIPLNRRISPPRPEASTGKPREDQQVEQEIKNEENIRK